MCALSRKTRPNSDGSIDSNARASDQAGARYPPADLAREVSIIRIANSKVKLLTILQQYGITISRPTQWSDWSDAIVCPLPQHNESNASFGYNFKDDFFYCLGCNAHGHAVEFISFKEGVDKFAIAEQIVRDSGGYDADDIEDVYDHDTTNQVLFEFASYVSTLVQKHKHDQIILDQIEKVVWWVDQYLVAKVPRKQIIVEDLEERLHRAKELLTDMSSN